MIHAPSVHQAAGMGLIIVSQAVQAGQICFEEFFMRNLDIQPVLVVGLEGVYGFLLQAFVVLPAVYFIPGEDVGGRLENTLDSFHMIASNGQIVAVICCTMVVMLLYNLTGMTVTSHLGALFRSILETMRTLFAWLVGLIMFYCDVRISGNKLGESWTNYSYLQAAGFVVLVVGTVVYGKGDERDAADVLDGIGSMADDSMRPGDAGGVATSAIPITASAAASVRASAPQSMTGSARINAYYDFSAGSVSKSLLQNSMMQEAAAADNGTNA